LTVDPGDPTRPLRPAAGAPVAAPVAAEDVYFREEVLDRLGALRAWVALATVLSLLALGLAALAYFGDDEAPNGGRGVRATAVQQLEDRIAKLESRPAGDGAAGADVAALTDDVNELSGRVDALAAQSDDQAAPATAEDAEAREGVAALDKSVTDLDARVQALEEQAAP
jgi:uncharacterized coiled-coil protein SlyX